MSDRVIFFSIALIATIGFFLYKKEPSFNDLLENGPSELSYFFQDHSNSDTKKDPYISSLYRPGDILYTPILELQNGRLDLAIPKLKELSERGNVDAMYWYADHLMKVSVKSRYEGYNLFEKSANLGNPYSAMMLDSSNSVCRDYFGKLCRKEWGDTAKALLQGKAEKGDIRAKYYLEKPDQLLTKKDFENFASLVEDSAKMNFFVPALEILALYNNLDEQQKEDFTHILEYIANHNYVPAYSKLFGLDGTEDTFPEAILLGSKVQLSLSALICAENSKHLNSEELIDCLSKAYTLEEVYNDNTVLRFIEIPEDGKLVEEAKRRSKAFIDTMTPTIYIDEMHVDGYF
ncbi:hypothetical protein A1OW_24020 [Enterovibrio norvegicus]|uniref:hypothetical protein n=1 Tax=Enterovibrio norvegicus TaxID=188144 RepID=UPI00031F41D9|nr:hypothetical protein [Enterovibrio norvegicus]OEF50637.1 hypothetical protein A1OW_24020 [Enterovibrio norvegicus]OEF56202.1 hypothetical protein A1OU_15635 [Enterovibrio norvegicus]PMH72397.1 hypothetical protein BCU62_22875 [Enterovibrio norvegicus]